MPVHKEDPGDPARCLCGQFYPLQRCSGGPILLATASAEMRELAARGVPFRTIASGTGYSLTTVRRVVHGT